MGPGIQEYPLLLHRETQQKESHSHTNENHKGMVNNGKSHPSTKGLNKPISYVKSPPGRLGKNVSSAIEKISHDTQDGHQPNVYKKGRNQLDGNNQSKRIPSVCSSLHSAQGPKRSPPERRQNESFLHRSPPERMKNESFLHRSPPERMKNESFLHRSPPERMKNESFLHRSPPERRQNESFLHRIPPGTKGSTQENFCRAKDVPVQYFYCSAKEQLGKNHAEYIAEASPGSSKWQASVGEMFLDFESVQIIKEDAEDDSASDLSDSERIPIPPSPCTPPELILRAEEIDPVCLEHIPEMGFKESEYYYPDFLPPPFNSWDLKQLATFAHVEGKAEFRPKPTGSLEKYLERLLQLEWLQMQTVQSEKGRATKARPQTAPGPSRALKSPGKGKALLSPVPPRQAVPQEGVARLPRSSLGHRAEPRSEESRQARSHPGHLKVPERMGCAAPPQRQSGDGRSELRKKPAAKQQLLSLQPPESSPKIQSVGNIRPPKQTPAFHGAAAPIKGLKTYMCTNPKKNGNASNYVPPKKTTVDRKTKTNGTKQAPRKFQ
ncbi:protein FAM217B isoform X1 [Haemorhous mexicanus]|uniref:protein FAM217B isoform X1 n=1 Tax=Haemorhous mexicanus TaxID=30427 RepID=UPI0028BEE247|nr:protein FAM217B isoform X1 [Haemorhous mexicanus]XP_059718467.1 protein FAM217B isoform X1 [Haemorhous mexicanus]XP_059718468.1 protein FAM217B isoform X1 [Haemorhous mexicanus]XP_059718469.1 protein FAM217B isoform X1 [Haemorhous mexicanus]